jgi:putative FmdB family regulatory protein
MPIYEYRCEQCGRQIEVIQKFSDEPLKTCTACNGDLTKLISQTSFQLKGAGWYVTDYARKDSSKAETKSSETPTKPSTDSTATKTATPSKD